MPVVITHATQGEQSSSVWQGAGNGRGKVEATDAADQHAGPVHSAEHVVYRAHTIGESEPDLNEPG
jgi:hypothetical protein